jgi:DNA primase
MQRESLGFYRVELGRSRQARDYLARRGIAQDAVERFSLGYAPRGWQNLFTHLRKKGYAEARILQSGLAARGGKGPYDVFRERLMFPILDLHGDVVAFGGRLLGQGEPKYLNSPETSLFRKGDTLYALGQAKEGIRERGYAAVVEGYMDAIVCHQYGFTNAVAPLGTALTEGHVKRLGRLTDRLLLVFDGDRAGMAAARRSLPIIMKAGLASRILVLPEGEDPDSILRQRGPEHFESLAENALAPLAFLLSAGEDRRRAVGDALEAISGVADPIVRDELVLELAERTRLSEAGIREKLGMMRRGEARRPGPPPLRSQGPYNEEELLLSAALAVPGKAREILDRLPSEGLRDGRIRHLLTELAEGSGGLEGLLRPEFPQEERTLVGRLSLRPGFEPTDAERVVEDCIRRINRRRMDEEIRAAERDGDLKRLNRLLSERQKLMQGT